MHQGDPNWADVVPLPQDDGDQPLAQIAYTDEYAEAMSYLRALMAREEYSERALEITERITEMNPAHYTVWYIRDYSPSPSSSFPNIRSVAQIERPAGFTAQK